MGIDYDVRLVFGVTLSWEEFQTLCKAVGVEDPEWAWEDEDEWSAFHKAYPGLYVGYASPGYASDCPDWTYYVGIGDQKESYTITDMAHLVDTWDQSSLRRCLKECGLSFQEPRMLALDNVC